MAANQDGRMVTLAMGPDAPALAEPVAVRVVGEVRMPRGPVRVDAAVRPMIVGPAAEK